MDIQIWLYYLLAILILTATPGPSVLLCISKAVSCGFRPAFFSALGVASAVYVILSLSFTGLGLLISQSEQLFALIKWVGAAYLIYLGIKALLSKQHTYEPNSADNEQARQPLSKHYVSGILVGASNPKAIVFFSALFPQFIDTSASLLPQYVVLAATFVVLELSWLSFYAYLGQRSRNWLMSDGRAKLFNRITGGLFVGAGALLSSTQA